jgi:hypothetical protein
MTQKTEVDGNITYKKVQPATFFMFGAGYVGAFSIQAQFQDLHSSDACNTIKIQLHSNVICHNEMQFSPISSHLY